MPSDPQLIPPTPSLRLPRVLFPQRGLRAPRPGIGWRRAAWAWWLLFLAVAVAWLGGYLWPDLSQKLFGR